MSRAMTRLGGDPSQVNLSKQVIRELLVSGKAVVQSIQGKKATDPQLLRGALYQRRCTSDVWSKFGSVRVLSADPGVPDTVCKDVVACGECYQVYVHRNMSQGTSSLRLHRCQKAAASVVVDVDYGALHLEFLQVPQQSSNPPPPPPQQQQQPKMVPAPVLKKILPAAPQLPVKVAPKPPPPRPVSPPMPPAPPPEVCLRWNSYHTNMQATFPSLLNNEQFVDVTLACEGRSIKCHKMILSACSSYFEDLLSQNPCQHPIVLMKDLRFWEVQALVDFMYRGEVNVGQDKLPSLLAAAEALQIKGLAGPASTSSSHDEDSLPPPLPLATDDFLDEPVPSPSSARRARKRRTTHQSPVLPLLRPQLSKPHLRPVSLPSTSSGYQEDLGSTSAEPPARRQRKFGPQIVDHKIKTEPVDIDLSNDSVDANDDGYMNKAYETGGGDSSGLGDDSADEHPSNTDNKDILQEQQLDTEQQHLDYGNNNGMPPPASNEGGLGYPHQAAPPYPELIMPAQDHDMAESIHGPV